MKAKGRTEIVDTCPYGAIYWNEEAQVPQKCTGCAHLMDQGWTETRCTQVCPTEAMKLVRADDAEMKRLVAAEGLEIYRPSWAPTPGSTSRTCTCGPRPFWPGLQCGGTRASAPKR